MEQRNDVGSCECGEVLSRAFDDELHTITISKPGLSFYTQWGDLYDCSPKEMARRKDVQRYDPSMSHKPEIPRTRLDVSRGIEDVDALVKHLAPVDGQHETDKMLAATRSLPEEKPYT